MVKRETGYGGVESSGVVQILDPALAENSTTRGIGIHGNDVIPRAMQRSRKPAVAAPDFQYACGRTGQL